VARKKKLKRLGVLTSGGDAPGMNPAIRAVVRTAAATGIEVLGFRHGYRGLMEADCIPLNVRLVSGFAGHGGTFLQSARSLEFKTEEGMARAIRGLRRLRVGGLVTIGGDGTYRGARDLDQRGVRVVGLPGSVDNDIHGTDLTLGVDSALNTIAQLVDMIKDTASSHERTFIVEVMGRKCGYLALASAVAVGAEGVLLPRRRCDFSRLSDHLREGFRRGKRNSIVIVAEGAMSAAEANGRLKAVYPHETRTSVLGHLQRGGHPSHLDRLLGARMGEAAVAALAAGRSGCAVSLRDDEIEILPLSRIVGHVFSLPAGLLRLAERTGTYTGEEAGRG